MGAQTSQRTVVLAFGNAMDLCKTQNVSLSVMHTERLDWMALARVRRHVRVSPPDAALDLLFNLDGDLLRISYVDALAEWHAGCFGPQVVRPSCKSEPSKTNARLRRMPGGARNYYRP